jgi:amidase
MTGELHWMSATELASRIAAGEISSREVLEHLVDRIADRDGPINAVVQWDLDRARAAASQADQMVHNGDPLGPLHGVPMTVKDSFQTVGCVTTSGAPELADFVPEVDAAPVARLREAGAVIFAKTNLPIYAGDLQSYNSVYGTTNNPHLLERTPGGSSGGSAAALAMGFTPLELGSDIGGSIRVPAHYCGVMGHKSSFGIVPAHGQIPGPPGSLSQADLAVAGPMARHAEDLATALRVISGPDRWDGPAWRLELPEPLHTGLSDLRIAAWLNDDYCRVDPDTEAALNAMVAVLHSAGANVDTQARPQITLPKMGEIFTSLLFLALSGGHDRAKIEKMAAATGDDDLSHVKRVTAGRHREWLTVHERRLQMRARWEEFFQDFDVMLMPVHPRTAIAHDHSEPMWERRVMIGDEQRSYADLFGWIGPAGAAYLPSTVVPVGRDRDGLPIGVQVVGPYLGDLRTIAVAGMLSELFGGCPQPDLAQDL